MGKIQVSGIFFSHNFKGGKYMPYHLKSEELTILPQKNEKDVFEDI